MSEAPIYVVCASDGLGTQYRHLRQPGEQPEPIVFETNINGATLEAARSRAAMVERNGYGAARIARLIFEDHPNFAEEGKST